MPDLESELALAPERLRWRRDPDGLGYGHHQRAVVPFADFRCLVRPVVGDFALPA